MSTLISGILADGAGRPMSGHHILLKARQNTSAVVMRTVATVVTGPAGEYAFEAQTGKYDVYLRSCIEREYCVGDISVYDDSKPGTLNDFLTALDEGDLKPDVVKRFEEMVAQAQQSAEAATESERQAGQHADVAARAKEEVKKMAEGVQQNADAVAEGKQQAENLVLQVENAAAEVKKDAEATKQAASGAEQARADIDTALSATLKTANRLSELADEGEEAQQESRDNLGLKSAATMTPQSDIRDRTQGRLALSGMYGFGQAFTSADALTFNGQTDFSEWLKVATPGRYAVSIEGSSTLLAGTTKFNGIIDVMWSPFDNDELDTTRKFKTLLCFNQYYEGEHSIHCLRYRASGNNWSATVSPIIYDGDSLAFLLSRTAGNGPYSYYKYPAVGVPIIAVYQGESFGADVTLGLGDIVPGSRLGPLAMSASVSDTGTYTSTPQVVIGGASAYNFPGRYMALSGSRSSHGAKLGFIGLFVRTE